MPICFDGKIEHQKAKAHEYGENELSHFVCLHHWFWMYEIFVNFNQITVKGIPYNHLFDLIYHFRFCFKKKNANLLDYPHFIEKLKIAYFCIRMYSLYIQIFVDLQNGSALNFLLYFANIRFESEFAVNTF